MKYVCLVSNYNYGRYLREALSSLLAQTRPFDLIIVVDDGSTDDSREAIAEFCQRCSYAIPIYKENGGQLSCFSAALPRIAADDLVFFMDADDLFPSDYLEKVIEARAGSAADFIFVNPIEFRDGESPPASASIDNEEEILFHSTSALTRKTRTYIGTATSCLGLTGALCHELLPYPYEKDWRIRADDILIFGASILGARKLFIRSLGIGYRIHGKNNFAESRLSPGERADWRLRHERLFLWYSRKAGVSPQPSLRNAIHEALAIPPEVRKRLGVPRPLVLSLFVFEDLVSTLKILLQSLISPGRRREG